MDTFNFMHANDSWGLFTRRRASPVMRGGSYDGDLIVGQVGMCHFHVALSAHANLCSFYSAFNIARAEIPHS